MGKTFQFVKKFIYVGWCCSCLLYAHVTDGHEIHLKNGKIIKTNTVQEKGGKIVYAIKGGTVSISKELIREIVYDTASLPPVSQDTTTGMTAYYAFNGNAQNSISPSDQGAVYGAQLVADRFGTLDSAYYFDGVDDKIQLPDPIVTSAPFSVALWFNIYDLPLESQYLLSNGGKPDASQGIYCKIIGKRDIAHGRSQWPRSGLQCGVSNSEKQFFAIVSKDIITPEAWHHMIFMWDGFPDATHVYLYLDGQGAPVFKESGVFTLQNGPQNMLLGASENIEARGYFNGQLDDICFYNHILSDAEVLQLSQYVRPIIQEGGFSEFQEDRE
jgi:hypothetical protein